LLVFTGVSSAFAADSGASLNWRNEGQSVSGSWTTGEIGPYDEGSLVPFRLTVTNTSKTKSAAVGGFALEVTAENHGVAVFKRTLDWTGPLAPGSQDERVDGMLRTTFPADLTLAPLESATFHFKAELAETTYAQPAAGLLNGNGVAGFSLVDAPGVGAFGKRVPVKVNPCPGLLKTPAVDLVKTSSAPATGVKAGTLVHYNFAVTNLGDIPLYNINVRDELLGDIGTVVGPIAPGETTALRAEGVVNETQTYEATALAFDAYGRTATARSSLTIAVSSSARIFGFAFADSGNGTWEKTEEPAEVGRVIVLTDPDGNATTTTTAEDGSYAFEALDPDVTYTLSTEVDPGYWISCPEYPGTHLVTPAAGQDAGPYDFGIAASGAS
jgi:hypothetical protein